jgi:hypothetical protein
VRGKGYSIGVRAGLVDVKHMERMGMSLWLFLWAVRSQTSKTRDGWGVVLYGRPVTYEHIHSETGFPVRTVRRWMDMLTEGGYLRTEREPHGMKIYIAKEKKFFGPRRELSTEISTKRVATFCKSDRPDVDTHRTKSGLSLSTGNAVNTSTPNTLQTPKRSLEIKDLEINYKKETAGIPSVPLEAIQNQQQFKDALRSLAGKVAM